jgi:hypothetical protein
MNAERAMMELQDEIEKRVDELLRDLKEPLDWDNDIILDRMWVRKRREELTELLEQWEDLGGTPPSPGFELCLHYALNLDKPSSMYWYRGMSQVPLTDPRNPEPVPAENTQSG